MLRRTIPILAATSLFGAAAFAGSFTNSLGTASQTTGITLNTAQDPTLNTYPIITNGALLLTYNEASLSGISMVLDDLDGGNAIDSCSVTFQIQFGPGSSPPADGFFFGFGPDINSSTTMTEEGPSMSAGFGVEFDTYRNLDESPWDDIGIDIKVAGTEIARYPMPYASTLVDSTMHTVTVQLNKNGTLNLTWNGELLYTNLILTGWAPTHGQFGFGARTGGSEQFCAMKDLGITTTLAPATAGTPTITTQPQSVTVAEGAPLAFTVDCETDAPLTIQWAKNGANISGATNWVLRLARADYADNAAKFTCTITGSGSVTSSAAVLTVTPTTVPPNLLQAAAVPSGSVVNVGLQFDKALDPVSAATAANYSVPGGTVTAATYNSNIPVEVINYGNGYDPINAPVNNNLAALPTNSGVVLTVSGLTPAKGYTVTVSNVANGHGDKMTAPQSASFYLQQTYTLTDMDVGSPTLAGSITSVADPFAGSVHYTVVGGGDVIGGAAGSSDFNFAYTKVTGDFDFIVQVTSLIGPDPLSSAELMCDAINPTVGTPQASDPFVGGLFTQEGNEVDNYCVLESRATASAVSTTTALAPGVVPAYPNCWLRLTRVGTTFTLQFGPDGKNWTSTASYTDTSAAFGSVTAVGLAVTADYDSDPVGGIATFDYFGLPVPYPVAITTQPAATMAAADNALANLPQVAPIIFAPGAPVTAIQGREVTLTVAASGSPLSYEWMLNGTAITGATLSTLTLTNVQPSNAGTYTVKVYNAGYSVTSSGVVLTVIADTNAPVVLAASALKNQAGTFDIGLVFDKPLDQTSATTAANYALSTGSILAVNLITNSPSVIVTASSNLTVGGTVTLTVKNVADLLGNKLGSTNVEFVVSPMAWGEVGGEGMATDPATYPGPTNSAGASIYVGGFPAGYAVVAVATNGFDLYSDGWAEWNNYDETTFVYEPVTGDFDKKLQVVYQDASSQWARAGLIMREDLSVIGMNDATQEGTSGNTQTPTAPFGGAGRYQKIHANPTVPTLTGPGTTGNSSWETNRRLYTGGGSSAVNDNQGVGGAGNPAEPLYPNVWCRLQRYWGTNFTYFRSDDGVTWIWMGTTTWSDTINGTNCPTECAMPATVYVGPEFSPENGNIAAADPNTRGRFLAQMRNYGDTWGPAPQVASRTYSIGVHFGAADGATLTTPVPTSLAKTDSAGIPGLKQANWNNDTGTTGSGTVPALVADQGGTAVPTTAGVTYDGNAYGTTIGQGQTNNIWTGADAVLMTGYLDSGAATTTTVTLTNLPAALTSGGYDVYVYACNSIGAVGGGYRILDAATGSVLKDWVYAVSTWYAPNYFPVPDNTSPTNYGVGNYIVFTGLKSAGITVQASTDNGLGRLGRDMNTSDPATPHAPINAIQLVSPSAGTTVITPTLGIKATPPTLTITFTGTLQSSPTLTGGGTWTDVTGATSPYVVTPSSGKQEYYRAKQ